MHVATYHARESLCFASTHLSTLTRVGVLARVLLLLGTVSTTHRQCNRMNNYFLCIGGYMLQTYCLAAQQVSSATRIVFSWFLALSVCYCQSSLAAGEKDGGQIRDGAARPHVVIVVGPLLYSPEL